MRDMEVDVSTKRARVCNQDQEIVTLDDDEEESINQIQGFPIEEECSHSKGVSHSVSTSEITISIVVLTEQKSKLPWMYNSLPLIKHNLPCIILSKTW